MLVILRTGAAVEFYGIELHFAVMVCVTSMGCFVRS